jgi:hypothetical protein
MKQTDEKKPMEMEVLSDETRAKLKAIATRIDELNSQIKELQQEAYDLVPKHTFDECREMKCIHTYRNCWDCHRSCVRRKGEMGNLKDYYYEKKPVFKPRVEYPMLGWKQVATRGAKWKGEWHGFHKVIQETEKTLLLDDAWKTRLFKSTIFTLEDVIYIKDRSGTTYFCADDPATLDMQVTLLAVANREWCERNCRLVTPMLETPDTSYPSGLEQREGETKEEWENRIFGE